MVSVSGIGLEDNQSIPTLLASLTIASDHPHSPSHKFLDLPSSNRSTSRGAMAHYLPPDEPLAARTAWNLGPAVLRCCRETPLGRSIFCQLNTCFRPHWGLSQ